MARQPLSTFKRARPTDGSIYLSIEMLSGLINLTRHRGDSV
jgi:hypothetical protein